MIPEKRDTNKMGPTASVFLLGSNSWTVVKDQGEMQAEHGSLVKLRKHTRSLTKLMKLDFIATVKE